MNVNDARLQAGTGIHVVRQAASDDFSSTSQQVVAESIVDSRHAAGVHRDEDSGLVDLALLFAILSILAGAYGFTGMAGSGTPAFVFSIALVGVIVALVLRRVLLR